MAVDPAFASTPHNAAAKITTAQTDKTGDTTTNLVTVFTAGVNGSKIEEITVVADINAADSTVFFFLHDGSTYYPFDDWDIGDPATSSTTVANYRQTRTYENLILTDDNWSLRAGCTVTPTSGKIIVHAFGGDF